MSSQRDGKRQVPAHFIYSVGVQQRTPNRPKPSKGTKFWGKTIPRPQLQWILQFRVLEINGLGETSAPDQDAAPRQHAAI